MELTADNCYRALSAKDGRFDGVFFVGVATTGIYCRPVCPARTPRRDRCAFFRTAAEAERAGFRACFRCRPELAPGDAPVDALSRLVRRATALIDAGFLNEHSVDALAERLGVTSRHLRRAVAAELGVTPVELAQTRRLALAKQLLADTELSLADVAFASGYASVRRFNAAFLERFGVAPSRIDVGRAADAGIVLQLDARAPFDATGLLAFLEPRAIPGVEHVDERGYHRTAAFGRATGTLSIEAQKKRPGVRVRVSGSLAGALPSIARRVRGLFDLDAHPATIAGALGRLRRRPGSRVPGAFDGFETAARIVLGQQVSVRAATRLSGKLVERFGRRIESERPALGFVFPDAGRLARLSEAELSSVGLTGARARALHVLSQAVASGRVVLERGESPEATRRALLALPGIGPWTAEMIALRVLGDPDAFPAGDLGLQKVLGVASAKHALARAERWRPWRAYAALELWQKEG